MTIQSNGVSHKSLAYDRSCLQVVTLAFFTIFLATCQMGSCQSSGKKATPSDQSMTQVWFGPDFVSPDMMDLFDRPEEWRQTRSQISVMHFYLLQQLLPSQSPCPLCGSNRIPAFVRTQGFAKLRFWNIYLAVEGAVGLCDSAKYAQFVKRVPQLASEFGITLTEADPDTSAFARKPCPG